MTKLKWTVEFEVDVTWVADGFILTSARALDMLSRDLRYADIGTELSAKVVQAPDPALIAQLQGYDTVNDCLGENRVIAKTGAIENRLSYA